MANFTGLSSRERTGPSKEGSGPDENLLMSISLTVSSGWLERGVIYLANVLGLHKQLSVAASSEKVPKNESFSYLTRSTDSTTSCTGYFLSCVHTESYFPQCERSIVCRS